MTERVTFTDSQQKEWVLQLDGPLVESINDACGVNLGDLKSDPIFTLSVNPVLLGRVFYRLCEKQAVADGVSPVDFGERLAPAIDAAVGALEVAMLAFFPGTVRSLMSSLLKKNQEMRTNSTTMAMKEMGASQSQIETAMAKKLTRQILKDLEDTDFGTSEENESATSSTATIP